MDEDQFDYQPEEQSGYRLLAPRWRKVEKFLTPKGDLLHNAKRYRRGDIITDISDEDVERLTKIGAIQPESDTPPWEREDEPEEVTTEDDEASGDAAESEPGTEATEGGEGQDEATGDPEGESETEGESEGETEGESEGEGEGEDAKPEPIDYSTVEYPELQRLAKEKTGDGSGGKQALIERLTAFDKAASFGDDE